LSLSKKIGGKGRSKRRKNYRKIELSARGFPFSEGDFGFDGVAEGVEAVHFYMYLRPLVECLCEGE
jgi:hypothetical protein